MALKLKANNGNLDLNTNIGQLIKGDDGGYYIPAVDEAGNLTWVPSEEEMPVVEGSNIKGPQGEPGKDGLDGKNGLDGKDGADGAPGRDGVDGKDGKNGIDGKDGAPGKDGADGKPFTYEDFTPEQLEALRGPQGLPGKDGTMTFEDLTDEQRESLKGEDGAPGKDGQDGYTPVKGVDYFDGKDGEPGQPGKDGEKGESGVYVGTTEPADEEALVWINPEGEAPSNIATVEYVNNAISEALEGFSNAEDGAY